MPRLLRPAALTLLALALVSTPARAKDSGPKVILKEDAYCGASPDAVPSPPEVVSRRTGIIWPKTFDTYEDWATLALTLQIDAAGTIAAITINTETPPGQGLSDAATRVLTGWRFKPRRPGDYCLRFSLTAGNDTDPPVAEVTAPEPPAPIIQTVPVYPPNALGDAVEGDVVLALDIAAGGAVSNVEVISETTTGYGFGQAAAETVRNWRFPRATKPGRYQLKMKFRLA
jgi:TonB family protein